jgi:trans-aconitate 2-methyltransferase
VSSHQYAFGDTDLAARRLRFLCDLFEEPSRSFLGRAAPVAPAIALDLGCGIGRTTRLVHEVTSARRTIGLDTSQRFLALAREGAPPGVDFCSHDATRIPLPGAPANLVYARLLLAHLPDPVDRMRAWASQVAPGGRLLLDENEYIEADDPALARYERLVTEVVGARGASMHAGPVIGEMDLGDGWRRAWDRVEAWPIPEPDAARMFAMNLATWRDDAYVLEHHPAGEIDELAARLHAVGASSSTVSVWWGIRQLGFERMA